MLSIEVFHDNLRMRMEGQFVGAFAMETQALIARSRFPFRLVVDMSGLTAVDAAGEQVLLWFGLIGGIFIANSSYSLDLCQRLQLPLAMRRTSRRRDRASISHRHIAQDDALLRIEEEELCAAHDSSV